MRHPAGQVVPRGSSRSDQGDAEQLPGVGLVALGAEGGQRDVRASCAQLDLRVSASILHSSK